MDFFNNQLTFSHASRVDHVLGRTDSYKDDRSDRWGLGVTSEDFPLPRASRPSCLPRKSALKVHFSVGDANPGTEIPNRQSANGTRWRQTSTIVGTNESWNETARLSPDDQVIHPRNLRTHNSYRPNQSPADLQYSRQILQSVISEALQHRCTEELKRKQTTSNNALEGSMNPAFSGDYIRTAPMCHCASLPFSSTGSPFQSPSYSSSHLLPYTTEAKAMAGSFRPAYANSDTDALFFERGITSVSFRPKVSEDVASGRIKMDGGDPNSPSSYLTAAGMPWVDYEGQLTGDLDITAKMISDDSQRPHQQTRGPDQIIPYPTHPTSIDPASHSAFTTSKSPDVCSNPSRRAYQTNPKVNLETGPHLKHSRERSSLSMDIRMPGRYHPTCEDLKTSFDSPAKESQEPLGGSQNVPIRPNHHGLCADTHQASFSTPASALITLLNQWEKTPTTAEVPQEFVKELRHALHSFESWKWSLESDDLSSISCTDTSIGYISSPCSSENLHQYSSNCIIPPQHGSNDYRQNDNLGAKHAWASSSELSRVPASTAIDRNHTPRRTFLLPNEPNERDDDVHVTSSINACVNRFDLSTKESHSVETHLELDENHRRQKNLEAFLSPSLDYSRYPSESDYDPIRQQRRLTNKKLESFFGERINPSSYSSHLSHDPKLLSHPHPSPQTIGDKLKTHLTTDLVRTMKGLKKITSPCLMYQD